MAELTGNLTTGQLRRVSRHGSITVTVMRRVTPGCEGLYEQWAPRMTRAVSGFSGCLGAASLGTVVDNEHHMVFRFVDGFSLRAWERSDLRSELLEEIEGIIEEERVSTVAGETPFIESLASARPFRPLVLRVASDALWIFPVAFLWSTVGAPWFAELPVAGRTLISAAAITLTAELALAPVRRWLRGRRGLPGGRSLKR